MFIIVRQVYMLLSQVAAQRGYGDNDNTSEGECGDKGDAACVAPATMRQPQPTRQQNRQQDAGKAETSTKRTHHQYVGTAQSMGAPSK